MHRKLDSGRTLPLVRTGMAVLAVVIGLMSPLLGRAQSGGILAPQAGAAAPQTAATGPQSFEVASIKPSAGDGHMVMVQMAPGGRYTASGVTVRLLIQQAYDVKDFQISGGPGWLSSDRYDIVAKAETNANREQLKAMLQSLLAERFQLVLHRETRDLPVYSLVVGKNGHKLQKSEIQPGEQPDGQPPTVPTKTPPPPPPAGAGSGGAVGAVAGGVAHGAAGGPEGGAPARGGTQIRMGRGQLAAQMAPLSALANMLGQQLGRPVLDKTGLTGSFDFKLEWTPDVAHSSGLPFGAGEGERPPADAAPVGDSGPSLFTAVQEQLGLRLEAQKGPVEILVIDHIEKPSEN